MLTAEAVDATTVELRWTAVEGAARYELQAWDSVNEYWDGIGIGGDSLTGTTYRDSGLTAGTTYYYQIRAVDASGVGGDWSAYVSATPGATNPDRAALVALYNATGGANWTHSATG